MKTILITAYAINPYKGSEDGTAWNMTTQLAKHCKVIAITRENNQEYIDKWLNENDLEGKENLQFAYFDLPYWMRFWKKGGRGALLYFYMWQVGIVHFIKKEIIEKEKIDFDIVHNLNFHSDWTPTFLWQLKKPLVWGPVGHHHKIPKAYLTTFYGQKPFIMDRVRWFTKLFFWKIDPFLKIAKYKAKAVLPINTSVVKMMNLSKDKTHIIPAVGSEPVNQDFQKNENTFNILSIGRFVPLKGFDITIKAFTKFYKQLSATEQATTKLRLVGKGDYEKALRQMIAAYQMQDAIEIISWVERAELKTIYEQAHLFFFPSHEGAGMVVPEAFSYRVPVLCFDNYGPGEFITPESGISFPYSTYENSINQFATALMDLFKNREQLKALENGALERYETYFDWEMKGRLIADIYEEL